MLTYSFSPLNAAAGAGLTYWPCAGACVCVTGFFITLRRPSETKGKTFEQIERAWSLQD